MTSMRRVRILALVGVASVVLAACSDQEQDVFTPEGDYTRRSTGSRSRCSSSPASSESSSPCS
jgi:hypothetical protein